MARVPSHKQRPPLVTVLGNGTRKGSAITVSTDTKARTAPPARRSQPARSWARPARACGTNTVTGRAIFCCARHLTHQATLTVCTGTKRRLVRTHSHSHNTARMPPPHPCVQYPESWGCFEIQTCPSCKPQVHTPLSQAAPRVLLVAGGVVKRFTMGFLGEPHGSPQRQAPGRGSS